MARVFVMIAVIAAGIVAQLWLLNLTIYWLWAAGSCPGQHPHAMRNVGLCSLRCFLIFLGQAALVWFVATWPARQRRRRKHAGCCVNCGYNLTGNISGRCPECGTAVGNVEESL